MDAPCKSGDRMYLRAHKLGNKSSTNVVQRTEFVHRHNGNGRSVLGANLMILGVHAGRATVREVTLRPDFPEPEEGMTISRDDVHTFVQKTLEDLARDWDVSDAISSDSKLFRELGLESLDAVILATSIQEKFGKPMPFAELFAEIGESRRDLTVAELVDFTWRSLQA